MPKFLAIESTSSLCSVALKVDEKISLRQQQGERSHTQFILPFIDDLLLSYPIEVTELDAIAFAAGPGSFTGIRLAASVAKSLAYAANIPVIVVGSLAALAQAFHRTSSRVDSCLVITDARMGEVYIAEYGFDENGIPSVISDDKLMTIDQLQEYKYQSKVVVGDAWPLLDGISWISTLEKIPLQATAEDVLVLAERQLALGNVTTALSAQAIYLRDKSSWKTTEQQQQAKLKNR
jgi:tRNA threonylcarbamoyladenosine biosynthesis protein TsaB